MSLKARIQMKSDTSVNWAKAVNFIPLKGEIITYSDLNKIKIGDGATLINDLDFSNSGISVGPDAPIDSSMIWIDTDENATEDIVQVQADWNQTDSSAMDYIKNKPDFTIVDELAEGSMDAVTSNAVYLGFNMLAQEITDGIYTPFNARISANEDDIKIINEEIDTINATIGDIETILASI